VFLASVSAYECLDATQPFRVHLRVRFAAPKKGCYRQFGPIPTSTIVTTACLRIYALSQSRNVLEFTSRFVCDTPVLPGERSMEDLQKQARQQAMVMAAAIFAARSLTDWDGGRSPRALAAAADAIAKAKFIVEEIERKLR